VAAGKSAGETVPPSIIRADETGNAETATVRVALDLVPIGLVLLDSGLRAQFINRTYRQMWQLPDDKADAHPPFIALLYHGRDTHAYAVRSDDIDRYIAERVEHIETGSPKTLDLRLTSGEVIRIHCTVLPSGGRMLCYTYVTDLKKEADELTLLRGSLDQLQQGIILLDGSLNARFVNRSVRRLWDIPDAQADANPSYEALLRNVRSSQSHRIPADKIQQYIAERLAAVKAGDPRPTDIPHGDGRTIRFQCAKLRGGGRMLTYSDVTDLVARARQFEELAQTDSLTGLYNRRHFDLLADAEWRRFKRYKRPLSLMLIDIDRFKEINDQFGHDRGDEALKTLALICIESKRSTDIVARVGGDEFAVLFPETDLMRARIVAERFVSAAETTGDITFSIGIAESSLKMSGFDMLKRSADIALYRAKAAGRNRICSEVCDLSSLGSIASSKR
jgi:diguanylate cyclase (GGDEF)-like protein